MVIFEHLLDDNHAVSPNDIIVDMNAQVAGSIGNSYS